MKGREKHLRRLRVGEEAVDGTKLGCRRRAVGGEKQDGNVPVPALQSPRQEGPIVTAQAVNHDSIDRMREEDFQPFFLAAGLEHFVAAFFEQRLVFEQVAPVVADAEDRELSPTFHN